MGITDEQVKFVVGLQKLAGECADLLNAAHVPLMEDYFAAR